MTSADARCLHGGFGAASPELALILRALANNRLASAGMKWMGQLASIDDKLIVSMEETPALIRLMKTPLITLKRRLQENFYIIHADKLIRQITDRECPTVPLAHRMRQPDGKILREHTHLANIDSLRGSIESILQYG